MYVLEGTAPLLQYNQLDAGDELVVARTGEGGWVIAGQVKQASGCWRR